MNHELFLPKPFLLSNRFFFRVTGVDFWFLTFTANSAALVTARASCWRHPFTSKVWFNEEYFRSMWGVYWETSIQHCNLSKIWFNEKYFWLMWGVYWETSIYYCNIPLAHSFTRLCLSICSSIGFRFRFRFFIHQALQQGMCLESGKHTNISKQQHWHTSTSHPLARTKQHPNAHTHTCAHTHIQTPARARR